MIALYDTLSREMKLLSPVDKKTYRLYCCGPTVYGPAHIGNFRSFLVQDVLRRLLESTGIQTYHVRNITDVDDKTIRQSQAHNQSLQVFTDYWTDQFHEDCKALNMLAPHVEPRAVAHIPEQITLIEKLIQKKHAYITPEGSVYFRVSSFSNYGRLSHLDANELQTQMHNSQGEQNLADEYTREAICDFALWKAYKSEDGPNFWESPWGKGRPGWHIECSAMAMRYLGEGFDLHCGGIDLCFPHHENEIAQSECSTHCTYAQHWLHNAHLLVNNQKMSKSLGNLYTLADIQKQGFSPAALRYSLIAGHYRQPLNFTLEALHASTSAIDKIKKLILNITSSLDLDPQETQRILESPDRDNSGLLELFYKALKDDLNVPCALGELFKVINQKSPQIYTLAFLQSLAKALFVLGIQIQLYDSSVAVIVPEDIQSLANKRQEAKKAKDYYSADVYRRELQDKGWSILDTKEGFVLKPISQ